MSAAVEVAVAPAEAVIVRFDSSKGERHLLTTEHHDPLPGGCSSDKLVTHPSQLITSRYRKIGSVIGVFDVAICTEM